MPLVYLDNCALQRPLDDRDQFRVRAEADAVTAVLAAVATGSVDIATSAVLRAETSRVRHRSRLDFAARVLALASGDIGTPPEVQALALTYEQTGLKPFDALHLASAVEMGAHYFCTTDDRLLKKARSADTRTTRVVTPLDLASALLL